MMKLKKVSFIIITLILTAALTACQQGGLFTNTEENEGSFTVSREIRVPVTKIRNVNPALSPDEDIYQMTKLVYNSLISLDDTLTPAGELAESWRYDGNGDIVFVLKKGIRFSDGSSLTADDVEFTVRLLQAAGADSPYSGKVSNISDISVKNDHEFTVILKDKQNTSPADFVFPVFSSSEYASVSAFLENTEKPVAGTGAYTVTSCSSREIRLTANQYTFETLPQNDIVLKVMPAEHLYPGLVSAGELSILIMDEFNRENLSGNRKLKVTSFTSSEFEALGFSCRSGFCSDRLIRQAIALALDREEIIASAYYGSGILSDDLYFPGYLGTETKNIYRKDPEESVRLLEKAGFIDSDRDGIVEDSEGNPLQLRLVTSSENASRKMAAKIIAARLAEIGIPVTIAEVPSASVMESAVSGGYDMFIAGWKADERYDLRPFYHSGYANPAGYSNPALDPLLDSMFAGTDTDSMKTSLAEAKKIIAEDVPYLCLCSKTYAAVTSADFEGLVASRFNDYYFACEDWSVRFPLQEAEADEETAEDAGEDQEEEEADDKL